VRRPQESVRDRPRGYVKSTRIYEGVPSQEHMANQGKSIEEIKGPDLSVPNKPEITEPKNITQLTDNATIVVMEPVREYNIKDKGLKNPKPDLPVPELEEAELAPSTYGDIERINDEIRSVTPIVRQPQESEETKPWGNVKSTRIYEGVPSQEHMANQGKSIEEIKGPDLSIGTTQSQYRTAPISSWSVQDYIDVTKPKFRNALLNRDLYTNKAPKNTRPRVVITVGEKQNETRTTQIKDWTRDQYLNITPAEKHNALNNMQKRPTITGGVEENKEERTKSIKDFTQDELLSITPQSRHEAIAGPTNTFSVGRSSTIIIDLTVDSWYSEASWNLYDSTSGAYYYGTSQTFSSGYENYLD